ncbi:MAG: VWA domain-containing protein, partial [Thermodesulfovibrionia bacterium]|nr:VWA domain-containing protein [Thermodesulfovibrionia bacterium]
GERGYISYLDEVKAIAINLLRQLDEDDSVAVVAFNVPVWTVVSLAKVGDNKKGIEQVISKLRPSEEGGTRYAPVLKKVEDILENYESDKQLVFLSDGWPVGDERRRGGRGGDSVLNQVRLMADKGIKIYSVSVGDRAQALEGRELMQTIAEESNGLYFWMEDDRRLKMVFDDAKEEKDKDYYGLEIYNKYHYITYDIGLGNTHIKTFNGVTEKSIAQVLVTTQDKSPIVTAWRFGIGRVVAVTTDNGREWSPGLYSAGNGKLISRITNWAMGDMEKKKKVRIDVSDTTLDRDVSVVIKSKREPTLVIRNHTAGNNDNIEGNNLMGQGNLELLLKQTDVDLYSSVLSPGETGFYRLKAKSQEGEDTDGIAVNYPIEYSHLGINEGELMRISREANGKSYNSSHIEELEEDIIEYVRKESVRTSIVKIPIGIYFIAAALALFFIDAVIRKIKEIRRLKRLEG